MSEYPRFTVNRHLVLIGYRQPFVDWLLQVDPHPPGEVTVQGLREDAEAFLVPENAADTVEEARRWVERRWRMFFDHMLGQWLADESLWPAERSLDMFRAWFEVDFFPLPWDLGGEPLAAEDWEEDEGGGDEEGVPHTVH